MDIARITKYRNMLTKFDFDNVNGFTFKDTSSGKLISGFLLMGGLGSQAYFYDFDGDGTKDVLLSASYPGDRIYVLYSNSFPFGNDTSDLPFISPSVTPTPTPTPSATPSPTAVATPTPTPLVYTDQSITNGGAHTGTISNENFIIDSSQDSIITGGGGDDKFTILTHANVTTTITDFDNQHEFIDISIFTNIKSMNDFAITKGSAIIHLPEEQRVILQNLNPSDLTADNFIFAKDQTGDIKPENEFSLSTGAIAGIAAGAAVVIGAVGCCLYAKTHHAWPFAVAKAIGAITPMTHIPDEQQIAGEVHVPAP